MGSDYFSIDHGDSYYQFFDQLGIPYFFIVEHDGNIVGVCVAILRELDINEDKSNSTVWYLCDLKIHPNYRGRFIIQKILDYTLSECLELSNKVYAISMNDHSGFNRIIKFSERLSHLKLAFKQTLDFYLLDSSQGEFVTTLLEENKNHFVSLQGVKDLVLESTKQPLAFMHFSQNSVNTDQITAISQEKKYMLCSPRSCAQATKFQQNGLAPMATASIIANFTPDSWDFIKTSDI